ncbi:MAG: SRPBCC family protein, partial [Actinomycetota bacterium]|nr:SRPBCC family protein [Actinomycetota bacterium]
ASAAAAYLAAGRRTSQADDGPADGAGGGLTVTRGVSVNRPVEELYHFCRDVTNLPRFSKRVSSVEVLGDRRSRWTATGPGGASLSWEVELAEEREPEALVFASPLGARVQHALALTLAPAPGDRGVEVRVAASVRPPGGAAVRRMLGEWPERQLTEELRRLKQLVETGEIATIEGQPAGRRSPLGRILSGTKERIAAR